MHVLVVLSFNSVIMLRDVSPHPPGPHVISAGNLDNPLALVTRLPDDDDLLALLLLILLILVPLVLGPRAPLPGVVDHTTGHHVLRFPLLGPVDRVISLRHSHHDNNTAT